MERLSIQLLGEFRVCSGDQILSALNTRLDRSLLALLLLRRAIPLSREEIAEQLWGEDEVIDPRHRLREHLSGLRKSLRQASLNPDHFILDDRQEESLQWRSDAPCSLDVADFEQLPFPSPLKRSSSDPSL